MFQTSLVTTRLFVEGLIMESEQKALFERLHKIPGNDKCLDCNDRLPTWTSQNNGAFICIKCCGKHRNMGVHISFVRSTTLDLWNRVQLKKMEFGGNAKLQQFWKEQNFPLDQLTPKERLDNVAMDKYRERLLKLAKGEEAEPIPQIGYHKRVTNPRRYDTNSITGFGSNTNIYDNKTAMQRETERKPLVDCIGACILL